jgi:hypothetical protein
MLKTQYLAVAILIVAFGLMLCPVEAQAQVNAGVLFLRIPTGARAAGMGGTFVAMADDATATHWNPAGLGAYPLNTEWSAYPMSSAGMVLDAVALKNGLPYDNFQAYDLWILTDQGLRVFRLKGGEPDRIRLETENVGSLGAAIRRYAPFLSEEDADAIARQSVAAQAGLTAQEMEGFITRLAEATPEGYRDRTIIENVGREFRVAFNEGRVDTEHLMELRAAIAALPPSGPVTEETQLDRVRFAMERSISPILPAAIDVRLTDLLRAPINAIAGDGEILYVASANGVVAFDGARWERVPAPAGLEEWDKTVVNCLAVTSGRRLWVGTNDGIFVRHSGQWSSLGASEGLPSMRVLKVALSDATRGWVVTDKGLVLYNDGRFVANSAITMNVGETLEQAIGQWMDSQDDVAIARVAAEVRALNGLGADAAPAAGSNASIPYSLGLRGDITSLSLDGYDRLWVGTTLGTFRYARGRWTSFGYEAMTVPEATTAQAIAESRLGNRATPDRVSRLTEYITSYNKLEGGRVEAGRTIYVYRNPAGSRVTDIVGSGDRLYVATEVGQLEVDNGEWGRYYHADLDRDQVGAICEQGGDYWFVTNERVVIYQRPHKEVSFMYAPWLPDFKLDLYYIFPSVVTHIDGIGTIGLSLPFLSFGEIDRRDELGNIGASFNSFDMAATVSYGTRLTPSLAAGLSAKFIYSRLADQGAGAEIGSGSGSAFAMDAGFLYKTPWKRLTIGGALTNLGPNISYIDAQQSDPLPRNLALGLAYHLWSSPFNNLILVADLNKEIVEIGETDQSELKQIIYNAGFEYRYGSFFSGRAGYMYDEDGEVKTPTVGAGISFSNLRLDFAYIPSSKDLPLANTLFYSLSGRF